ncbi:MAG: fibronectin type III domain-containing protein, partial [Elusimicrobia bacterium]|nr:fibronectin type III domain-containing protein [Elusimicrobiota bacterium]
MPTQRALISLGLAYAASLLLALPASAVDDAAPSLRNLTVTNCNGERVSPILTNRTNPEIRLELLETGPGFVSGMHLLDRPLIAGTSRQSETVLFYDFDEAAGAEAVLDYSTNFGTGAIVGSAAAACDSGPPCRGPALPGRLGWGNELGWPTQARGRRGVEIPRSSALSSIQGALSIQAWIRVLDSSGYPIVEVSSQPYPAPFLGIWVSTFGRLNVWANLVSSGTEVISSHTFQTADNVLTVGSYHLITVTYSNTEKSASSGAFGVARIFVDDVERATSDIGIVQMRTDLEFRVGHSTSPPAAGYSDHGHLLGYVDQLRILRRALRDREIAETFSGGRMIVSRAHQADVTLLPAETDFQNGTTMPLQTPLAFTRNAVTEGFLLSVGSNTVDYRFSDRAGNINELRQTINVGITPPAAPVISGFGAASENAISYSIGHPLRICTNVAPEYVVYDCASPTSLATVSAGFRSESPLAVNAKVGRRFMAVDRGQTTLQATVSGSTTTCVQSYTHAAAPTSLTAATVDVTTVSMRLTWDGGANPSYTRYELTRSTCAEPCVPTVIRSLSDNFRDTAFLATGLAAGTTYYWRVRAFNGDAADAATAGGLPTAQTLPLEKQTRVEGTTLSGVALGPSSIQWSWAAVEGASLYEVRTDTGGAAHRTSQLSAVSTGYGPNELVSAQVVAEGAAGFGAASPFASAHTLAEAPGTLAAASVSSTTIGLTWGTGANPGHTTYDIVRGTDAFLAGSVSTVNVSGAAVTLTGLFPATRYFLQVRAKNGDQLLSSPSPVPALAATTSASPGVTTSSAPYSAYASTADAAGVWHFDEGSGTTARDASGFGNHGALRCDFANCISTPTYVAGPDGLGSAVKLPGQNDSFVLVPDAPSLNGTGGLTLEAWVKPSIAASAMTAEATVLAKGDSDTAVRAYGIDVSASRWRFFTRTAGGPQTLPTSSAP